MADAEIPGDGMLKWRLVADKRQGKGGFDLDIPRVIVGWVRTCHPMLWADRLNPPGRIARALPATEEVDRFLFRLVNVTCPK